MLRWADAADSLRAQAMLAAARTAYERFPTSPVTAATLKAVLQARGRWSEAATIGSNAPSGSGAAAADDPLEAAAAEARRDGSWHDLLVLCVAEPPVAPPASVRFHHALAAARLGIADTTIDPGRDTIRVTLVPKQPWHSVAGLNRNLLRDLAATEALDVTRHRLATRDGRQSELLAAEPGSAMEELLRCVRAAIDHVVRERPWLIPPDNLGPWGLHAWSVSYPEKGRQISHFHPDGWLSTVYCVARPPGSQARLTLGSLAGSADDDLVSPWPMLSLDLGPGECAIFPSWMPHAATPTGCAGDRVVVAIDVVPAPRTGPAPDAR